ncbi:MAG: outer membrane lipoprotein-sorting protein [Bacteroidales bacterium]|nr:outer membrane lipoprotein-sorting protein [Bacteroidales bacterium]
MNYWVSKQYYLPVKVENYDEFGDLASTINFREIKRMGNRDFPSVMEMIPATRSGQKTILTTTKADFGINLSQSFFTLQNLTNIR